MHTDTPPRLQRQIDKLRENIQQLGNQVSQQVLQAISSFKELNAELAQQVILKDQEIDAMEVDIEEECLKILALYQPVASDLRYLVAIMKINNDLERIGDLAVNISKRVSIIANQNRSDVNLGLNTIITKTCQMLEQALQSMTDMNSQQAQAVRIMDDEVDDLNRVIFEQALQEMQQNPSQLETLISQLNICRCMERIADHATNIAEDVIYMAQGNIVRHNQA